MKDLYNLPPSQIVLHITKERSDHLQVKTYFEANHINFLQIWIEGDDRFKEFEVALRGLSSMLPRLREYFGRTPRPVIDGGYSLKTRENRLLAGPLPVQGAYVIGAVSGYGIMSACAAGELLASHVAGNNLPSYAPAFSIARYDEPEYQKELEDWGESGQL